MSERTFTVSVEDRRKWLAAASYHVRLAAAIAALAPKLRLASVLALTWSDHIDAEFHYISVRRHKTATKVKRPQVVPISDQLERSFTMHGSGRTLSSWNTGSVPSSRSAEDFKRQRNVPGSPTAVRVTA